MMQLMLHTVCNEAVVFQMMMMMMEEEEEEEEEIISSAKVRQSDWNR